MKAFWASVILFGVMLILIIGNAAYIHETTDRIRLFDSALDNRSDRAEVLSDLNTFWSARRRIISLSVGYEQLDHLTETIDCLRWADSISDEAEFERYRILLRDAIDEIERTENFSVENLF